MTPEQILEQEKRRQAEAPTPADILAGEKARMADSANGSFYVSRDVQPDRASKVISLSDRMGAQPDFVDQNLETIEAGESTAKRTSLLSELPRLANYFSDPYRAAEASDSVPNFAEIERAFIERRKSGKKGWLEAPFTQAGDLGRSAGGEFVGMFGMGIRGMGDLISSYVALGDNLPGMAELNEWERDNLPEWTRQLTPQEYLRTTGGGVSDLGEIIRPEEMGIEDRIAGALGQIVGAVVTTITAGPQATAALFFGMGADQQGQSMRRAGIDPDDKPLELAAGASVTALSEQMRLNSIMRMLPKSARDRVVTKALSRIAGQAGEEAVQESVEGILQNLITTTYDADANVFDGILEQAGTAGTAAAIFQALVEVALPGKQRGRRAEQAAQELTDIRTLIEETPVFQRSRQAVENFLNEAGDGETVLLHGDDLIELFQSDPQVFEQRMEEIGLSEEDVQRAAQGMDVEVEAAKILSVSEGFEDLVQRVRIDDDTPSLRSMEREIEESDAMGAVDFQEAFEQFQEQDQALEGFERVQSAVTEQLLGAGRSQAESQAAGAVWGAMFRQLSEAGVDEGAVFERLGLQINPEQAPRMPKPQEPQTLHSFVRGLGGIREAFGEDGSGFMRGEVDSRLGERVPGLINNASGVTLDEIYRAATEEGGYDIRDEQELLDLLERDLSGERVYPIGEAEVYAAELEAYEAQFERPEGEVMDQAAEAGYEGSDRGEATEWLRAVEKGLDMSQEARMARAQEMGFDTDTVLYHGTDQDFVEFRLSERGKAGPGIYLTPRPEKAERYAMDRAVLAGTGLAGQVKPVFIAGELASFEDRQSASQAALEKIRPKQDSMPSGDFNRLWSKTRNEVLADQGYSGIQISDEVVIFDPSNIRSVNAAFDPDASDSANLLAQSAPASMREALRMQPQDRAEWFDKEVTQRLDADGTTVLTAKSRPDRETDDIAMRIDDGGGVTMRFEGRLERRDNKVLDPETGKMVKRPATREEVQQSVLAFSRSIAMLEEYVSREKPESIHFTGSDSTDTRNKMYLSLLKRMRLPSYRAFEVGMNRISTAEVEGDKRVRSSLHNRAFYVIREDAVERKRAQFRDGELRTSENAPPEGVEGPTYRDNFLDTADEVGRIEPGRVGQSDGRRSGDGVRGATFTEIEPAQRELFQSTQQEALPSEAGIEIPDSNGLVAIRADELGFTTSAEKALFDPPPRFRDARNLTAVQWRKYFREAGATKEAFEFMIEPALATLPKTGDISKADVIKAVRAQRPEVSAKTGTVWSDGMIETDYSTYVSPGQHSNYQQELIVMPEAAAGYKSHNWKTEGVVGHIRTTDRATADGESVRFVDELQSDLHQEGAQYGYRDGPQTNFEKIREQSVTKRKRFADWATARDLDADYYLSHASIKLSDEAGGADAATGRELLREARAAMEKLRNANPVENQPPRAPVKDWEKPFIRRVIQQAIEDDKELVAFTNHKTLNTALQNEGTKKFYDDRLPAHIRKVAKELGAKVERVYLSRGEDVSYKIEKVSERDTIMRSKRTTFNVFEIGADPEDPRQFVRTFETRKEAQAFIRENPAKQGDAVLAIRITPEAREKLAQGNVLFQEKRASVLIPGGGVLTDQNVIVNLLKKKDRTSFMHESAHIFLELYAALESENEVIAERMAAVRKWLKIKPGEKITRDQHEKFAESFEAYLMEGVAPSAELRSVFHSFRQWFIDVYRRLRGQLRNLEPEAKDIFDRMLASDIEIEMAQNQYVGTLNKAMEGIMNPEQVEKYQKHARKAGNVARDKLFKKHMAQVRARERKAYKEERDRVEDMARAQLSEWPEYKALAAFREGGRSLDAAQIDGETKLNTSENGEHPEIVAPEMGFRNADEMLKAVAKAPSYERVVKETTDKIMRDRYGDMMEDGSIEAEAMEAVFNEPSIRMMEAERNALAAKASAQPIPLIAIRKRADQIINETPIDKVIKPGRYAIKARDLHKRALRAAARGKWDEALRITHQAMLIHELARRAFKARDEIEKANRYLAKFAPHRKLDPKKIAPEYIAQIRALMSLPGGQDQTEARDGLISFADAQATDGYAVVLPSDVVAGRDLPIRRRMTMEQLREFRDGVKNLNTLGRQQSAEAVEQFNAEAQAVADEIDENWKGKRKRETRNPTRGERLAGAARTIDAEIIRWPFLVEALQGGKVGKIVEIFDTKLRQALTNRNARRQKMADELAGIFRKHKITQSELNKRVSAPVIEAGNVKFEQIIAVAMNMGTEQNRDRLVSDPSMNGDMAAIEAMLTEHLEQRHWDAVQEIWDLIGTMWPEASAVERKATGVSPKKVDASSVSTPYGQYRGGYYPLKYDKSFLSNTDLKQKDNIDEWKNGVNGMATRASTQQGFLKERQQNVERPLRLGLDVILSHIDDVTNDIYMREPASYVSRLLQKRRVQQAIRETQGPEYLRTMETILKRAVTGTERAETMFEKVMQTARINASVAILGGNVVTAALAPISYFQTVIPQYGFKTVFSGIAEYYSNPIKNAKLIVEKSAFMRERQDTLTREAHELIRKSAGQTRYAKVQGAGYWMMAIAEKHSVSGPLWVGVYNQAKAEGDSEADAITRADRAVSTTQGSGLELDQSVLQGGNEGVRLLTFMWGYVSGYYGTVRNDVVSAEGLKKLIPLVKHMVILNLVASMLEALIRGGFGDEEDPYVVAVWQMMMRNTFGLIPGVSNAVSKYDSGPAAFQAGTSVTRATENWYKAGGEFFEEGEAEGETVRRAMIETAKAGGFIFGVPGTVQAMKIEKTYVEDDDPTLYEAIVTGPDDDN